MKEKKITLSEAEIKGLLLPGNLVLLRPVMDPSKIKTETEGVFFYIDTSWNPDQHQPIIQEVIRVPHKLRYGRDMNAGESMEWKTDISIEAGDIVWMSYRGPMEGIEITEEESGDVYYLISYSHLYMAKKNDKLVMLNGYLLIEPIMVSANSVLILDKKESNQLGKVVAAGKPNQEYKYIEFYDDPFISEGHTVLFRYKYQKKLESKLHAYFKENYRVVQRSKVIAVIDQPRKLRRRRAL